MARFEKKSDDDGKSLKSHGIIYLSGSIEDSTARTVCEQILEINLAGEVETIQLIINSCGGSCSAGFAIIDLLEWSKIPIHAVGLGQIASMALLIFMAGTKRIITPRTSILSHRFSALSAGSHAQLIAGRREEDLMHQRILDHFRRYSRLKTDQEVESKLLRETDVWLTPEEAVEYGLADIIEPLKRGPVVSNRSQEAPNAS